MIDAITFGLAYTAYLLLCGQTLLHLRGQAPRWLTGLVAAAATAHVALVWHARFAWSLAYAWSKNPAAFLIFHAALALIAASAFAPARWSGRLLWLAFPVVTLGALGAVFRAPVVAGYRWPVVVACAFTVVLGAAQLLTRRSS